MAVPNHYYLWCPVCEDERKHKILKGEVGTSGKEITIDGVVECQECGHTRHKTIREKAAIDVPVIISWKKESEKTSISLLPDEWVHKGEEFIIDNTRVKVTSLETKGRRKDSAQADDIVTIWTKKHDKSLVKIALHKGRNTISKTIETPPEEKFFVNQPITVGKNDAVIYRIKTKDDIIKDGSAKAEDIRRIYAKMMR